MMEERIELNGVSAPLLLLFQREEKKNGKRRRKKERRREQWWSRRAGREIQILQIHLRSARAGILGCSTSSEQFRWSTNARPIALHFESPSARLTARVLSSRRPAFSGLAPYANDIQHS